MQPSAFTLMFLYAGVLYSWGIFQADIAKQGVASAAGLSAVGGLQAFFQAIGCMPATLLLKRVGPPKTAALGMSIAGMAFVLSSWSMENIGGLVFLQGIVFGLGGSLVYLTAYTAPSRWFINKRGLCTGIASCGGGLGEAVFALAAQRLLVEWGMRWTYRFFGFLLLSIGLPVSLLLRAGPITDTSSPPLYNPSVSPVPPRPILRSSRFIRVLMACFIASYLFYIPPYYISQYAQSVGLSASLRCFVFCLIQHSVGCGKNSFWRTSIWLQVISLLGLLVFSLLP